MLYAAGFNSVVDFATKETTILDTATKRYAKPSYDQFAQEMARPMPEMPAQSGAAMANLKADVSPTRVTGGTAVIQGVEKLRDFKSFGDSSAPPQRNGNRTSR